MQDDSELIVKTLLNYALSKFKWIRGKKSSKTPVVLE